MPLVLSVSVRGLTSPSVCRLQRVSTPRSVGFFSRPNKSLPLTSSVREYSSIGWFLSVP